MALFDLILAEVLVLALLAVGAALVLWWSRERRLAERRDTVRALDALAEEIIVSASVADLLDRLTTALPAILRVTGVRLYCLDRAERVLNLAGAAPPEPRFSIPLDGGPSLGPALSFRNRSLLAVSDLRRSPAGLAPAGNGPARSAMYVPILRRGEATGILEVTHESRTREFSLDERAAAQHLANQVGAALGLIERQSLREQVIRSEKLVASGQLISGVAGELRAPLKAIAELAARVLEAGAGPDCEPQIRAMAREARRAGEIVDRLVSFSHAGGEALRPLDLIKLLRNLIELREREWIARGITIRNLLPDKPALVLGIEGQLEQVFLSLLVHAEKSVAGQADRTVSLGAAIAESKVVVEISFARAAGSETPNVLEEEGAVEAGTLGLALCRGVLRSSEGDIRFNGAAPHGRFEVTLPLVAPEAEEGGAAVRAEVQPLMLVVVEPDAGSARRLLMLLAERGHRAVLASSGEEALALAERFRFDALFCGMLLPGISWIELLDRLRERVRTFVLLTEGYDAGLAREAGERGGMVLSQPVSPERLDHALAAVAARTVVE